MGTLVALAFVTPLFGLSLSPPDPALAPERIAVEEVAGVAAFAAPFAALDDDGVSLGAGASARGSASIGGDAEGDADADAAGSDEAAGDEDSEELDSDEYAAQLHERADLTRIHRPLGIATYAAMGLSLVLGTIQYYNLYGFFADQGSNPCVKGTAVFGQGQCTGFPLLHAGAGFLTAGLYTATFAVSLAMPDPDDASEGDSEYAKTLRMHKTLRWVHFGGMVAQMLLGIVIANAETFGMDRANDYGTLQALATVHLGVGLATFGAMTWAMVLML